MIIPTIIIGLISPSLQEKEVTLNNEAAGGAEAGPLSDFMQS